MMNELSRFHPAVNFAFFFCVLGFSVCLTHPAAVFLSLAGSIVYGWMLNGRKRLRFQLFCLLPLVLLSAAVNAAFNHDGVTVLTYLPDGNPFTAESLLYGFTVSCRMAAVINWFSCCGTVMTDDKIVCLFGRVLPSLSLIFSMALRFIPRFKAHLLQTAEAKQGLGQPVWEGSLIERGKQALALLSATVTWSLENALETADSMKSRGYGLPGRTSYSHYTFDRRDGWTIGLIGITGAGILTGIFLGAAGFRWFPSIRWGKTGVFCMIFWAVYAGMYFLPVLLECGEAMRWNFFKSKR